MTNICEKYTEYKQTKCTFKVQCALILMFIIFCGGSLAMTLLQLSPLYSILSLNMSLVALGSLFGIIARNRRFVTYSQYRKNQKKIFEYMEQMLDNQESSDDEILVIMDHRKLKSDIE